MNNKIHGEFISQYAVKIKFLGFKKTRYGSGVLLKRKKMFYVITAKHNFKKEDDDEHTDVKIRKVRTQLSKKKIIVLNEKNEKVCDIDRLVYLEENLDLAVFSTKECLVELDELLILTNDNYRTNEHFYYGFQGGFEGKCKNELKNMGRKENDKNIFRLEHSKNIINGQYFSGYSGSGVFIENDSIYYLVGILIKADETSDDFEVIDLRIVYILIDKKLKKEKLPLFYDEVVIKNNYEVVNGIKMVKVDKSLYVSICPITFEEYDLFYEDKKDTLKLKKPTNTHFFKDERGNYPVINITWNNAMEYCLWLGDNIRLPTIKEWEEIAKKNDDYFEEKDLEFINKVGSYKSGKLGIYDMYGNIYQWCLDIVNNKYRAIKGSSFDDTLKEELTTTNLPECPLKELGFRIVLEKDKILKK